MRSYSFAFFILASLLFLEILATKDCDNVLAETSPFTGLCSNKWHNLKPLLKPTQNQVGYAWIQYKLENNFKTLSDAQKEMDSSATPAVIGPDNFIYVVDDHHTLCSLDFSTFDVSVTLNIVCDKRNLTTSQFWSEMTSQKLVYLFSHPINEPNALPTAISYSSLPSSFSFTSKVKSMSDDPWRAMAGYSRKVTQVASPAPSCTSDKYCERCFYRGCVNGYKSSGSGVAFFEFRWSYFLNDATFYSVSIWPSEDDWKRFYTAYTSITPAEVGSINTAEWFTAANFVVALCRASNTSNYSLPSNLFSDESKLPGYFEGYEQLTNDPDCSSPTCV